MANYSDPTYNSKVEWGGEEEKEPPRFASLYYGGTRDRGLSRFAVDTSTTWQGYYPTLYDPSIEQAARHRAAPSPVQVGAAAGRPGRDGGRRGGFLQDLAQYLGRMNRGDWDRDGRYGDYRDRHQDRDRQGGRDRGRRGYRGAYRPELNPEELAELVPWTPASWVVSMGQWRGT